MKLYWLALMGACCVSGLLGCGGQTQEAAKGVGDLRDSQVTAQGSDALELFINGQSIGKVDNNVPIAAQASSLVAGDNVIAIKAKKGTAVNPFLLAELAGSFGRIGTSSLWRVKTANGVESNGTNKNWTALAYDDSAWVLAQTVAVAKPSSFPADGVSKAIWGPDNNAPTVLFRLRVYLPTFDAAIPSGYGQGVTGGAGGQTVRVTTPAQLAYELCRTQDASGHCTDTTPRIVEVASTLDFTGLEGSLSGLACVQMQCAAPMQSENSLDYNGSTCTGKTTFNITYDKAGTTPLTVGSNKTLIGVGSSATIKGKGLRLEGVSNVIVRNITLAEINAQLVWGGDALDMNGADRVWIDHNRFWRIGRQMIVTHFAGARNVTFSWNDFDGTTPYSSNCNNTHYWVMLILGADTRVTLTNNWVHDFAGRSPHAGGNGAKVAMHLANNYFQRGTGHAADPGTTDVKLLFEGNYYKDVVEPIKLDGMPPGYVFAPIAPISSATLTACQTKLGRACVINQANPMPASNSGFQLDSQVLDTFSQVPRGALLLPYPVDKVPSVVPHLAGPGHI